MFNLSYHIKRLCVDDNNPNSFFEPLAKASRESVVNICEKSEHNQNEDKSLTFIKIPDRSEAQKIPNGNKKSYGSSDTCYPNIQNKGNLAASNTSILNLHDSVNLGIAFVDVIPSEDRDKREFFKWLELKIESKIIDKVKQIIVRQAKTHHVDFDLLLQLYYKRDEYSSNSLKLENEPYLQILNIIYMLQINFQLDIRYFVFLLEDKKRTYDINILVTKIKKIFQSLLKKYLTLLFILGVSPFMRILVLS